MEQLGHALHRYISKIPSSASSAGLGVPIGIFIPGEIRDRHVFCRIGVYSSSSRKQHDPHL